jgi:PAS domain S-box-containing protein
MLAPAAQDAGVLLEEVATPVDAAERAAMALVAAVCLDGSVPLSGALKRVARERRWTVSLLTPSPPSESAADELAEFDEILVLPADVWRARHVFAQAVRRARGVGSMGVLLEQIFDGSHRPMTVLNHDGAIGRANVAFGAFTGLPVECLRGPLEQTPLPPGVVTLLKRLAERTAAGEERVEGDVQVSLAEGAQALWRLQARPLYRLDGATGGCLVTWCDASDERRSAQEFEKLTLFFDTLLRDPNIILACVHESGRCSVWNRGAEEILGYTPEEAADGVWLWKHLWPDPEEREGYHAVLLEMAHGGAPVYTIETPVHTRGGVRKILSWDVRPLHGELGEGAWSICLGRDVTEQRSAEHQHAARLERLGRQQHAILELATDPSIANGVLPDAFSAVAEAACFTLRATRVSLWVAAADGRTFKCVDMLTGDGGRHSRGPTITYEQCPEFFEAVELERVVAVSHAGEDIRVKRFCTLLSSDTPAVSALASGIRYSGRIRGLFLCEHTDEPRSWAADEITIAAEFADVVAQALINEERARSAQALERSETLFRTITEQSGEGIVLLQQDGHFFLTNRAFCAMTGYRPDELRVLTLSQLMPLGAVCALNQELSAEEQSGEVTLIRKDGTTFVADLSVHDLVLEDAEVVMCLVRDVTERTVFQRALRREHEFISAVFDTAGALVAVLDKEGRLERFNRHFQQRTGFDLGEVRGKCLWEMFDAVDEREQVREQVQLLLAGRPHSNFESAWHTSAGEYAVVAWSNTVLTDSAGEVEYVIATGIDVTDRHRAEAERLRLAQAVEQTGEAIFVTDVGGLIQYVNPAFEQLTGYSREEAIGSTPALIKSGQQDSAVYKELWKALHTGRVWRGRLVNKRRDGAFIELESTISPVRSASGNITNYVSVNRDVTNEVRLERQLRQSQKLEAIGTLAGGIAHDFNNILAVILGFSELVREDLPEESGSARNLREVIGAVERARGLVEQMLTFSRHVEMPRRPVQVGLVVKEALKLMRASIPTTVEFVTRVAPQTGTVFADPSQIHQVVMNLCTNAYHAMQQNGGVLQVTVDNVTLPAQRADLHPQLREGEYVQLVVADTGHGMSEETLERIFEPFFTTKEQGKGTGLGLAVVHGIVTALDGAILVQSNLTTGTTFEVLLPRVSSDYSSQVEEDRYVPIGRGERVLVVDDEPGVLKMNQEILERLGYRVQACNSSSEALNLFEKEPHAWDIVVTDQTMPKLTGVALATRILERRPELPIIIATGYSEELDLERAQALGMRGFLQKPYNRQALARAMHDLLVQDKIFTTNVEPRTKEASEA